MAVPGEGLKGTLETKKLGYLFKRLGMDMPMQDLATIIDDILDTETTDIVDFLDMLDVAGILLATQRKILRRRFYGGEGSRDGRLEVGWHRLMELFEECGHKPQIWQLKQTVQELALEVSNHGEVIFVKEALKGGH
mmetsp:Transcript_91895/g.263209  ORF Transcript_91895/g.263209 Transcript_91895/m.263209 type:complete len:136 (+) Transcript_91895:402-809(+)